jgi:hypothetical protein
VSRPFSRASKLLHALVIVDFGIATFGKEGGRMYAWYQYMALAMFALAVANEGCAVDNYKDRYDCALCGTNLSPDSWRSYD